MIKTENGQHHLEFGQGDIKISAGWTKEFSEQKRGLLIFENQNPPQPIGKIFHRKDGKKIKIINNLNIPVFMTFSKIESVDALIAELEEVKMEMKEG